MVINPVVMEYEWLVGGLEPWNFMTFHILGMSSSQLTISFFRGVETTNQVLFFLLDCMNFMPVFGQIQASGLLAKSSWIIISFWSEC